MRAVWRRLRGGQLTPARAAYSVAIGLAVGVTPLWGLHWVLLLAIGLPLRLDVGVAWLASQVSLPFLAPLVTFAEIQVGARVLRGAWPSVTAGDVKLLLASPRGLTLLARELVVGTLVVSPASAVVGGTLTFTVARLLRARRSPSPEPPTDG